MEYIHTLDPSQEESIANMLKSPDSESIEVALGILNTCDLRDKTTRDIMNKFLANYDYMLALGTDDMDFNPENLSPEISHTDPNIFKMQFISLKQHSAS